VTVVVVLFLPDVLLVFLDLVLVVVLLHAGDETLMAAVFLLVQVLLVFIDLALVMVLLQTSKLVHLSSFTEDKKEEIIKKKLI